MPKAFTDQEKDLLRARFLEKGRSLFESFGLRKTSVEDLARAAGVSKGAFYQFFPSKEELFMQILEELETDFQRRIFDFTLEPRAGGRHKLSALLKSALMTWDEYPLLKRIGLADYEYLARKLPAERIQAHADRDDRFVKEFIDQIRKSGIKVNAPPRVVANLMKCLFFISLHRDDLGPQDYAGSMDVLADLVAGYMVNG